MNKKKKKHYKQDYYPIGTQRLDRELMSEIKMLISLGKTVSEVAKIYHVSEQMVRYSCRMGKDFDSLQKEFIEKESDK